VGESRTKGRWQVGHSERSLVGVISERDMSSCAGCDVHQNGGGNRKLDQVAATRKRGI